MRFTCRALPTFCLLIMALLSLDPSLSAESLSSNDADIEKVLSVSIRLKKAHVEREWEDCLLKSGSEERCKSLLKILWEQEKTVLSRISQYMTAPTIDKEQLNTEMTSCYNPSSTYTDLIRCWSLLADRLDAAKAGKTLLRK